MKDFLKETGKYLYDISKIILGLAIIAPIVKDGSINAIAISIASVVFIVGAIIIYIGASK